MITDNMIERFEKKVKKTDDCWLWLAAHHKRGYGYFYTSTTYSKRKMDFAHRFSYHLYKGYKPTDNDVVCHKCDNPSCVNPNHLFIGTQLDNNRDMMDKGRYKNGRQKLIKEKIEDIVRLRKEGLTVKEIAILFNINSGHCSRVSRGVLKCQC